MGQAALVIVRPAEMERAAQLRTAPFLSSLSIVLLLLTCLARLVVEANRASSALSCAVGSFFASTTFPFKRFSRRILRVSTSRWHTFGIFWYIFLHVLSNVAEAAGS